MAKAKITRSEVHAKRGGKCAYCGSEIPSKGFHVDHRDPCWRNRADLRRDPNSYTLEEVEPACPRCNRWKTVHSVEQFRAEITAQVERLRRDVPGFRLAEDFGLIQITQTPVVFHFER